MDDREEEINAIINTIKELLKVNSLTLQASNRFDTPHIEVVDNSTTGKGKAYVIKKIE